MARWTKVKTEEYEEEKYMEGIVWEKSKMSLGVPGGSVGKNSSAIARGEHLIPGVQETKEEQKTIKVLKILRLSNLNVHFQTKL